MLAMPAFELDLQPFLAAALPPPSAAVCQADSTHWLRMHSSRVRVGEWLVSWNVQNSPSMAQSNLSAAAVGQQEPTIGVALVGDSQDAEGRWLQTYRLTIRPGGTLSDASLVIYGDTDHVQELFEAARQSSPDLSSPGLIQAGQQFEVTVDASRTFVVKEITWDDANGIQTTVFYNGVRLVGYTQRTTGVLRVIEFPGDRPTQEFRFPLEEETQTSGGESVSVPASGRLVDYAYDSVDGFRDVVQKVYTVATVKAMQDFILQSQWDPNRWPPPQQHRLRIVTRAPETYADETINTVTVPLSDPVAARKLADLNAQRMRMGVYPVRLEGLGTLYRVAVSDPTVTARDVAQLLYNSPDRYTYIATQAGVTTDRPASENEAAPNPLLIGRSFEVFVQYDDEQFLLQDPALDPRTGVTQVRLLNGTLVEAYQSEEPYKAGLVQVVHYPSGYKRTLYEPGSLTLDLLDFLSFVLHPETSDIPPERRQALVREFQAQTLWDWGISTPRKVEDQAEWVRIVDSESKQSGPLLEMLIKPPQPIAPQQLALLYLLRYPILIPLAVVVVAVILTAVIGGMARLATIEQPRRRWR